jgi:hypothetical protein
MRKVNLPVRRLFDKRLEIIQLRVSPFFVHGIVSLASPIFQFIISLIIILIAFNFITFIFWRVFVRILVVSFFSYRLVCTWLFLLIFRLFFKAVDNSVLLFEDLFFVDAVGNLAENRFILSPNGIDFLAGKLGLDGFVGKVLIVSSFWLGESFFLT